MGIGHERDIPLAALAADKNVSTPTAAAYFLNSLWQRVIDELDFKRLLILNSFESNLIKKNKEIEQYIDFINSGMNLFFNKFEKIKQKFFSLFSLYYNKIHLLDNQLNAWNKFLLDDFQKIMEKINFKIFNLEKLILNFDPRKPLFLGYSLVKLEGKILKTVKKLKKGQKVEVLLKDGEFISKVEKIKEYEQKD
jgi:exodeoxyribonuclease VII large subunit